MIRRLLPHPLLSLVLALVWLGLVNRWAWGSLVFALLLGLALPPLIAPWWPGARGIRRPWRIPAYLALLLVDIIRANVTVALIVLFKPRRALCEATGWGASRFDPRRLVGFPRAVKLSRMRPLQGTNIPSTVTPISAVAAQPSQRTRRPMTCGPITLGLVAMLISTAMIGTATTPLMTADQNSSFTGSVGVKHNTTPTRVAATITP